GILPMLFLDTLRHQACLTTQNSELRTQNSELHNPKLSNARRTDPLCVVSSSLAAFASNPDCAINNASLRSSFASRKSREASSADMPVSDARISRARRLSFSFVARRFDIRLLYTNPSLIIVPVDSMLRIIFCAVPAFIRDEPAMTSGPTAGAMLISASAAMLDVGLQLREIAAAPTCFAYLSAPSV